MHYAFFFLLQGGKKNTQFFGFAHPHVGLIRNGGLRLAVVSNAFSFSWRLSPSKLLLLKCIYKASGVCLFLQIGRAAGLRRWARAGVER